MRIRQYLQRGGGIGLLLVAANTQAGLINIGNSGIVLSGGVPNPEVAPFVIDGNVTPWYDVGLFELTVSNPLGNPNTSGTIYTFCTDVGVTWRPDTYTAVQFGGQTGVNPKWGTDTLGTHADLAIQNASWLYDQIFEKNTANYYGLGGSQTLAQMNASVAMQLAIWEALYDTGSSGQVNINFYSGRFALDISAPNSVAAATALLTQLNNARISGFTTYNDTWLKPNDLSSQGFLYNNLTPVPEPTTMIAGALLLLPFGASTLRILRRNRTA